MRVPLPHKLGKDEVRRRLKNHSHEIADSVPGGARVDTQWPSEDRMTMAISAMGHALWGAIEIEEEQVVIELDLPLALSFLEPIVKGAVAQQGQRLLAPPKG
ncbi:MAG: polyhydroxyalkanoic acid system family protein [Novosphingobium sp.]|nr:polyhydroxyalkanoic acid system family protein [Novosphingobium sp.]